MPYTDEQLIELINKSMVNQAAGGQVSPENVSAFVNLMSANNEVFQNIRVERDIIKSRTIDGLEFGDPVVQGAPDEGSEPADNTKSTPSIPRLTLTPGKTMIAVDISFDWLRKNVAGEDSGEAAINAALATAAARDYARLIFNGDTDLDDSTKLNRLLNLRDGILKQLRADADVNDVIIGANPVFTGKSSEFSKALKAIPEEYRDDRSMLRHYVPMSIIDDYEDEISERQTTTGDMIMLGDQLVVRHKRVKLVPIYGMPANTTVTSNYSNIVVGFGRDMKMWREIKPRKQQVELTIVTDMDFGYVFGEPVALGEQA